MKSGVTSVNATKVLLLPTVCDEYTCYTSGEQHSNLHLQVTNQSEKAIICQLCVNIVQLVSKHTASVTSFLTLKPLTSRFYASTNT